ncbi:MAG: HAD family hydrolase [Deltaproteobacteria bacterium CG_4_8_14_3_um_filter_45_9]|nr:MAG: HAD family hydrolase [Deltaproteobacteria bacterium CG_4_8_14_3_um_filter_45_9]
MPKVISFDMDGTLVNPEFTDWVWLHGIPTLYAEKVGLPFEEAKAFVVKEYLKVGEGAIEWYDIKYWFQFFRLKESWKALMGRYVNKINIYPDVHHILERLKDRFQLVLTSNAGREFIAVEMEATGLVGYFDRIFSATSDFGEVKKTVGFYQRICQILEARPQEIVHVGDHYEFDYLVPRTLGIHAFYLDRSGEQNGDFVISDLRDIEERLLEKHQNSTARNR